MVDYHIPQIEVPRDTNFATIKEFLNMLQLITSTPRPVFNLPHTDFEQVVYPPTTEEELGEIHTALLAPGACIHIKALSEKHKIGFCYELLTPPNPIPKHWHLSLLPSHELDSTNTRSLQISLAGALNLVQKCEATYNQSYQIPLSTIAWKQYQNNMHVYPTRGYSSLFKPGSDAFKVVECARRNTTSTLYELDIEDFLIEGRGKILPPRVP